MSKKTTVHIFTQIKVHESRNMGCIRSHAHCIPPLALPSPFNFTIISNTFVNPVRFYSIIFAKWILAE